MKNQLSLRYKFPTTNPEKYGSFKFLKAFTATQSKLFKAYILENTIKTLKTSVKNKFTGLSITISKNGLKHSLAVQGSIKKIKCLTIIEDILKTAYLTNIQPDKHNKKLRHFILTNIVYIDNELHFVDINIKEDTKGKFLYHMNLMSIKKPEVS